MDTIQGIIVSVTRLTDRIASFQIAQADGRPLPSFAAGAHIDVALKNGGHRSYSLVSTSGEFDAPQHYTIAVQREDSGQGGSIAMHGLSKGDLISFSTPKNDFRVDPKTPAHLVAGGIGVTPLVSMAKALIDAGQNVDMTFAGRSKADMVYTDALSQILGSNLTLHFDDVEGQLKLDPILTSLGDRDLYVCGPRAMIDALRDKTESIGIEPERIHFELFEAAKAEDGDTAFEVQIEDGRVFTVPIGKTIIEVLEEEDVDVMYDCKRGDCGVCQCDVLEGIPDHRDVVLSETERDAGDVMQICVSRAKSARLVLDI